VNVLPFLCRSAQPRNTEDQCKQIFEKGQRIEQEFAEFFTGKPSNRYPYTAVCTVSTAELCRPYLAAMRLIISILRAVVNTSL
jgi:hypothetical protein